MSFFPLVPPLTSMNSQGLSKVWTTVGDFVTFFLFLHFYNFSLLWFLWCGIWWTHPKVQSSHLQSFYLLQILWCLISNDLWSFTTLFTCVVLLCRINSQVFENASLMPKSFTTFIICVRSLQHKFSSVEQGLLSD